MLENVTFWNRKEAAQRVALGDVRMLFSDLREIQDKANVQWNAALDKADKTALPGAEPAPLDPCDKRMKLSIAGHSFGGLIVYTSIAQSLIRDIVALRHDEALQADVPAGERIRPRLQREGDLVVVINPAIEATRFHPLFRAASEARLLHYHTPIFVSITSRDDRATRRFFPIGRWFSTRWDRYPRDDRSGLEEQANLYTFGHADDFVTHFLSVSDDADVPVDHPCRAWNAEGPLVQRLAAESKNLAQFRDRLDMNGRDGRSITPRRFCGIKTMDLTVQDHLKEWAGNSPVWNIRTGAPIVDDHNDFSNPMLLEVLRQLYAEAEDRSFALQRAAR